MEGNKIEQKYVYRRNDGRYEARYVKGFDDNGKKIYGAVYGDSEENVIARRNKILDVKYEFAEENTSPEMNLLILGAGSHGQMVKEIAENLRVFKKIAFLDDKAEGNDIIGKCSDVLKYKKEYPCAFVAIGDNKLRKKYGTYLKKSKFLIPNIISPSATVSKEAVLGEGIAILPQCTVASAEIGDFCILASNSLINYGCKIEDYSRIECGAIIIKGKKISAGTLVNTGEIV